MKENKGLSVSLPGGLNFGVPGKDGATFTPSLDDEGNLSWSNDKGLQNPETKNIRGPKGEQGEPGAQGPQGIQGEVGPAGPQGPEGPAGDVSDDKIAEAVKEYMDENPVKGGDGNALYYSEKTNVSGIAVVTIQKGAVSDEWTGLSGTPHVGDLVISATGQLFKVSEVDGDTMYMGYIMDLKTALPENIVQSVNGIEPDEDGNVEIETGGVTDEQVNNAVEAYLNGNPVSCSCVFDATKVTTANQFWFTGKDASAYGTVGQVVECKVGERFFWNGKFATNGGHTTPKMLSALPNDESIYDTSVTIGAEVLVNEDGSYTATADGAIFFPAVFHSGSAIEGYINNGYTYLGGGNWFVFKGGVIDAYYAKHFPSNHVFNVNPSPLDLAGMLKNYIPMVGAKAAILGDSLSEQSAGYTGTDDSYGFGPGDYNAEGWFARIARKYSMDYRVHGKGMQRWYVTPDRPNGGVKAAGSLIESGYNPDYIVLEYGTNDIWTGSLGEATDSANAEATSTVGALRYCIETLQAKLPSAKIIVVMPCMRGVNDEKQNSYYELIKPILREYGVRYVDMLGDSGIVKSMMNADGVHLATFDTDHYNQHTEAVARYSRCLESAMLRL